MNKVLIFLFFISFVSNRKLPESKTRQSYKGGKKYFGKVICPSGFYLNGDECIKGQKEKGTSKIKVKNDPKKPCPPGTVRVGNICRPIIREIWKPVIYLYPEKSMDISVQLNLKNSNFSTVYPKFNEKIHGMSTPIQMEILF